MTNIEFLVNELRKANETIAELRKTNKKLKDQNKWFMERNKKLAERINKQENKSQQKVSLGDIDALAALKAQLSE